MTDWQAEALKWKNLSRKNELRAKLNYAQAQIFEAKLKYAVEPKKSPRLSMDLTLFIENRHREIKQIQILMSEIPGSSQQHAKHRS